MTWRVSDSEEVVGGTLASSGDLGGIDCGVVVSWLFVGLRHGKSEKFRDLGGFGKVDFWEKINF